MKIELKIRIESQRFLCFKAFDIMTLLFSYQIFSIIDFLWGLNSARASQCRLVFLLKPSKSGATRKLDPDLLLPIIQFSLPHHFAHSSFGGTFSNRCNDASAHITLPATTLASFNAINRVLFTISIKLDKSYISYWILSKCILKKYFKK